ncbi:hypothetical protein K8S19_04700 [bacterium]|nr:hypothetical protein [bacterium]
MIQTGKFPIITLGLFLILITASVAQAVTYTVTSREDSGAGTLREAVQFANGMPGDDIIIFSLANSITVYSPIDITSRVYISGASTPIIGANDEIYGILRFQTGSDGSTLTGISLIDCGTAIEVSSNCN